MLIQNLAVSHHKMYILTVLCKETTKHTYPAVFLICCKKGHNISELFHIILPKLIFVWNIQTNWCDLNVWVSSTTTKGSIWSICNNKTGVYKHTVGHKVTLKGPSATCPTPLTCLKKGQGMSL